MVWVRSEYAGELAVIAAWVSALLPWSVTFLNPEGMSVAVIRFLPLRLQFIFGLELAGERPILWVWEAPAFEGTAELTTMSWVWLAGTAVFLAPFALSVAYYAAEERVEALSVDPVRLMGGLLALTAVVFTAATVLLYRAQPMVSVPLGVVFMWVFSYLLLRVERT